MYLVIWRGPLFLAELSNSVCCSRPAQKETAKQ